MTNGSSAMPTPQFNRTPVANPTNNATGTPMTQQDWYTYGERPEASFYANNAVPLVSSTGVSPSTTPTPTSQPAPTAGGSTQPQTSSPLSALMTQGGNMSPYMGTTINPEMRARGGALGGMSMMANGGQAPSPEFDSAAEQHVRGPGNGTSDDIPAKLSDGEYVMDANTVSMLGNGSNDAGARQLDQLRQNLRKHAAKPMAKGKQFMKAKSPTAYMRGGSK
jgi:hypothetical protein